MSRHKTFQNSPKYELNHDVNYDVEKNIESFQSRMVKNV